MLDQLIEIKLKTNINKIEDGKLYLYDEDSNNNEYVKLELHYCGKSIESSAENYFDAFTNLRKY